MRAENEFSAAQQENKRLRESLQEAQQKLPELQKQLEHYNQAKTKTAVRSLRRKHFETSYIII